MEVDESGRPLSKWAKCPYCGCRERILADEGWDCPRGCMENDCPECGNHETTTDDLGDLYCPECGWGQEEEE